MTARLPWTAAPDLAHVMAGQSGLFTAAQGRAAGYPTAELQRLREDGSILSVRRGVYAGAQHYRSLDEEARHRVDVRALLLRCKAPTTISHESAAVLQGLALLRPDLDRVHATRPELRASRLEAGAHHHPGALPAGHVIVHDGIAMTSPARTAVDLARRYDFGRGVAAVDSALRAGASQEEICAVMEMCRAWAGARGASRAVSHGTGGPPTPARAGRGRS